MNTEELYATDLQSIGACSPALEFVSRHPSLRHAIAACTRADWLAWLLRRVDHPLAPRLEAECVRRARMHADAAYAANAADAYADAAAYAARAANAASDAANAAARADAAARAARAAAAAAADAAAATYAAHAATYAADAAAAAEHRYLCDWVRTALAEVER